MSTWRMLEGYDGTYTSDEISVSPEGYARIATFDATESTPASYDSTYYIRYSSDGSTWSSWATQELNSNISSIIGRYIKKIQYKIELTRDNVTISPEIYDVSITINNTYIHINDGVTLVYDTNVNVQSDFTQIFYAKLPSTFTGIFLKFDEGFQIGYNGTRFYYQKGDRLTAGTLRALPNGFMKIAVKSSKVFIYADTYTEILR